MVMAKRGAVNRRPAKIGKGLHVMGAAAAKDPNRASRGAMLNNASSPKLGRRGGRSYTARTFVKLGKKSGLFAIGAKDCSVMAVSNKRLEEPTF